MSSSKKCVAGLLVGLLALSGCYGPFNLTRRLHRWNGQVGEKWAQEFVFIVMAWAPVYGLAVLGDAVVFNSIEFWTGENPVNPPLASEPTGTATKRVARGTDEALLTYSKTAAGPQLVIEQFQQGHSANRLTVERRQGATVGLDAQGRVLFTADTQPDGQVIVRDSNGIEVATHSSN